jgi:hypothetical protein
VGARGPVPKRSEERVRRNKPETPVDKIEVIGPVEVPELNFPDPHPLTVDLYASLSQSAQSRFYEASDYQMARAILHFFDIEVKKGKASAQMVQTVFSQLTDLLLTEGARRRVRLEVERDQAAGEVIEVADMFRARLMEG